MKKLTDKEYIRNLHYKFTAGKTYYERLDDRWSDLTISRKYVSYINTHK